MGIISHAALLSVGFIIVGIAQFRSVDAGFALNVHSTNETYVSNRCVSHSVKCPGKEGDAFYSMRVQTLQPNDCDVFRGKHVIDVDRSLAFQGSAVFHQDIKETCNLTKIGAPKRLKMYWQFAKMYNISILVDLLDRGSEKLRVPGLEYYISSSQSTECPVPHLNCDYVNEAPFSRYEMPLIVWPASSKGATLNISIDKNEYRGIYENILYNIWFRGFGMLYLYVGMWLAPRSLWSRKNSTVPFTMLSIEMLVCSILGVHFVLGCNFGISGGLWPQSLHIAFVLLFTGSSLTTSILAGLWFHTKRRMVTNLTLTDRSFFAHHVIFTFVVVIVICVALDVVSGLALVIFLPNAELIVGGVCTLGQLAVGVYYFRSTTQFIILLKKRGGDLQGIAKQAKRMALLLRYSSIGMLVYVLLVPVLVFSGEMFYGMYSPLGWAMFWGIMVAVRLLPSYCQVLIVSPPKYVRVTRVRSQSTVLPSDAMSNTQGSVMTSDAKQSA